MTPEPQARAATFTLTDTETGLVVVATGDAAEVRTKITEVLSYEPAPAWFALTVRWDGKERTLKGVEVMAWYRKGS